MPCTRVQRLRAVISIYRASAVGRPQRRPRSSGSLKSVHRPLHPVVACGVLLVIVFSTPSPIHACVGIILRLTGDRVAVAEQELFIGIALEVVIAADVYHCRATGLGRCKPFASMRK